MNVYIVGTRDFVALSRYPRKLRVELLPEEAFFGEIRNVGELREVLSNLDDDVSVEVWTPTELIRHLKYNCRVFEERDE
jgi:hypothetical protein